MNLDYSFRNTSLNNRFFVLEKCQLDGEPIVMMLDGCGCSITKAEWDELKEGMENTFERLDVSLHNERARKALHDELNKPPSPKEKKVDNGFVYFLKSETGHYKIGKTSNVKSRIKTLQVCSPYKLDLYCYFKTSEMSEVEEKMHEIFHEKRANGEWFSITEEEIDSLLEFNNIEVLYNE